MQSIQRLAALALVLCACAARAQNGEAPNAPNIPPVTAVKLAPGEVIRMDGSLSDSVWQRAPAHKQFIQREPNYGQPTPYETWMQVAYDDRHVYVGVTAFDPQPQLIRDPPVRHDLVLRTQDHVIVYIDPIGKKQSAQFFRVSASGSTADGMQTASDDSEDFAPDFDFDAKARRNARGYTFVLRIPFASLRYTNDQSLPWRIMAARRVPRDQFYWMPSVPIPLDSPNLLVNMQELRGVEVPKSSHFLTLRPSVTLTRTRTQDAPSAVEKETKLKPTLDFKWRATPELVIDGTIKPDFSQLDLDVPQLGGNSRFALFYPEKRPFFFEATDVMRSPTDALYTRSFTEPNWGVRGTWRGTVHAGTAMAVDDKGGGLVLLPGPYATNYADQPGSRTIAARELADAGPLQLGGVVAARRYEKGIGDNIVAGPDIGWQVSDTLRIRAQWLRSSTSAQPDAAGVLQHGPTTQGSRLYFRAVNQTENNQAELGLFDIGEGFRHDTGFVPQVGVRGFETRYGFVKRQFSVFNEMWFNFHANYTRDRVTGETVKADPFADIYFSSLHNQQATLELHGWSKVRASSGAPLLHEKYISGTYSVTPATWIPLVESSFTLGRLGDMLANEVRPGARVSLMVRTRPLKQLEIEPRLSSAVLYKGGKQTYRETAATLNAIWFFDANQSIRAILQRTLLDRMPEPGVTEVHDRAKVASVTYAWRRSMGTVLYVGASVQKGRFPLPSLSRGSEAFVKVQVDYDELRSGLF